MRTARFTEQRVTYTVEVDGRVIIVENVPAREDGETGEHFFSPAAVEQIQTIVWAPCALGRSAETLVFRFEGRRSV